jgi:hypothetical protein
MKGHPVSDNSGNSETETACQNGVVSGRFIVGIQLAEIKNLEDAPH